MTPLADEALELADGVSALSGALSATGYGSDVTFELDAPPARESAAQLSAPAAPAMAAASHPPRGHAVSPQRDATPRHPSAAETPPRPETFTAASSMLRTAEVVDPVDPDAPAAPRPPLPTRPAPPPPSSSTPRVTAFRPVAGQRPASAGSFHSSARGSPARTPRRAGGAARPWSASGVRTGGFDETEAWAETTPAWAS